LSPRQRRAFVYVDADSSRARRPRSQPSVFLRQLRSDAVRQSAVNIHNLSSVFAGRRDAQIVRLDFIYNLPWAAVHADMR